jgi:hypothetical protein
VRPLHRPGEGHGRHGRTRARGIEPGR